MKTILSYLHIGIGIFLSFFVGVQAQTNTELLLSANYELTVQPTVQINIGGVIYNKQTSELHSGSQMGNVYLSGAQFAAIEAGVPKYLKFEIKKYGVLSLRDFVVTNIQTKEQMNGLYDVNQRTYLFGNSASQSNQNCGALALGVVQGTFNAALTSIDNGQIGFTYIVGCTPAVVAINVTFNFKAVQTTANIAAGTQTGGTWAQSNDAQRIKTMLVSSRWKTTFWARQGNIIQPQANDFVQFYANGTMDVVLLGLYDRATWKYNTTTRALEITFSSGELVSFFLKETGTQLVRGYSFQDEFYFSQISNPNQPVPVSASARTKILCATYWQLNYLQLGLIRWTYKPIDFIRFYANGEYEQSLFGVYAKGTWKWENSETRVNISANGPVVWDITTLTNTQLSVKNTPDYGELFRSQGVVANESENIPQKLGQLSVYPNPAREEITAYFQVAETKQVALEIFDLLGKRIYQAQSMTNGGSAQWNVNVRDLPQGAYLVRVGDGAQFIQKSVIVMK